MRHLPIMWAAAFPLTFTLPAVAKPRLTVLQNLTQQTGGSPEYPPIIGRDGVLYGTTYTSNNAGGIYSIGTDGKNFAVLYEFPGGAGGSGPFGGLTQGPDGLFYGTTLSGGTSGQGAVFQFNAATRAVTILHAFDVADGSTPYAGLVQDGEGNLYGTTSSGGANNLGTIFEIAADTFAFSKLADLDGKNGGTPYSPLLVGSDGLLYGTATGIGTSGNGTIFRVSRQGGKIETLYRFSGQDGSGPFSGLTAGQDGTLYGTTDFGGSYNAGTVFAFATAGNKLSVLHSFSTADGAYPQGRVAMDQAGRLLGTTFSGGASNGGTIYVYDPSGSSFKILENLYSPTAGTPNAGLTYAGGRKFFGGTLSGGTGNFAAGAIIRFSE